MPKLGHDALQPGRKAIFGPEPWREIAGVTFVYWDRWLLRLALDEPDGLEGLVWRFEADRRGAVVRALRAALLALHDPAPTTGEPCPLAGVRSRLHKPKPTV